VIHFLAPRASAQTPEDYIRRADLEGKADILCFEDVLDGGELPHGLYVFAGINRLGPALADLLAELWDELAERTGIAPLNHPTRSLRRYELLRALHREGWNDFTAYGVWEDYRQADLPAFVRPREADGGIPTLRHSMKEIEADVGHALMNGRDARELIVVEFDDTSVDGLFYKYAAYRIGDRIVPVSIDRGTDWVMRRHASDITEELLLEERAYVSENPHDDQLREIFRLARIDFGRIDYALRDGRVVCWEINTLPMLRRPHGVSDLSPELSALRDPRRELFRKGFEEAFAVLFEGIPPGDAVRPELDPERLRAARREVAEEGATTEAGRESFALLRRLLRPFKPVLKPIAKVTLQPLLARRARKSK